MNLHRATEKPDWTTMQVGDYNSWQRLAASTNGAITPGNILTVVGFAIVSLGLVEIAAGRYWAGGVLLAAGRACDLADGWLADMTGTKSPLGELLDASLDKIGTLLTVAVFWQAGVAPPWALAALILPHFIISIIVLRARQQSKSLHPSRLGKLSMAAAWFSLLGFVGLRAAEASATSPAAMCVYALTGLSLVLGLHAAQAYARGRY